MWSSANTRPARPMARIYPKGGANNATHRQDHPVDDRRRHACRSWPTNIWRRSGARTRPRFPTSILTPELLTTRELTSQRRQSSGAAATARHIPQRAPTAWRLRRSSSRPSAWSAPWRRRASVRSCARLLAGRAWRRLVDDLLPGDRRHRGLVLAGFRVLGLFEPRQERACHRRYRRSAHRRGRGPRLVLSHLRLGRRRPSLAWASSASSWPTMRRRARRSSILPLILEKWPLVVQGLLEQRLHLRHCRDPGARLGPRRGDRAAAAGSGRPAGRACWPSSIAISFAAFPPS